MSLQSAQKLAARGLAVFPIKRGTKDKILQKNWARGGATTDSDRIWSMFPEGEPHNVGVLATGKVVLDIDCKHGRDGFAELAALEAEHGKLPTTYVQRTPSGGLHYFFDVVGETFGQRNLTPGIDVRATGGYALGAGSEFDDKLYTVEVDAPIAPLPAWVASRLRRSPLKGLTPNVVGELDQDASVEYAKRYLTGSAPKAVEYQGGNNTTYEVAARCFDFGLSNATVFELMSDHWNGECSPPWEFEQLEKIIDSAETNRQRPIGCDNPIDGFSAIEPFVTSAPSRIKWLKDVDVNATYDWLVEDTIPLTGVGLIAGASGSGKTFVLADLIGSLARGLNWFGRRVNWRVGACVVAAESAHSVPHRMKASSHYKFGDAFNKALDIPVTYVSDIPNFRSAAGVQAFISELKAVSADMRRLYGVPLGVVGIDTWGQAFDLADENAAPEATKATKVMQQIADALGCVVVACHHFGHNGKLRGSTAIRANMDFVIEVRPNGELFLEKQRDAQEGRIAWFDMPVVTVSHKPDMTPVTSRYVTPAAARSAVNKRDRVGAGGALDAAFAELAVEGRAELEAVRKLVFASWGDVRTETKRKRWSRLTKEATGKYDICADWIERDT